MINFLVLAIFLLKGLPILKSYTVYILLQYLICFKLCGKMNIIVFFKCFCFLGYLLFLETQVFFLVLSLSFLYVYVFSEIT